MTQDGEPTQARLGWIGTGRMGYNLAKRLLDAGQDVAVYNRTRSKAEPLAEYGATIVGTPADLADREIIFTMVGGPEDFKEVVLGSSGVLSATEHAPRIIVDSTTVSISASEEVRTQAAERGVALLAAPVSGNPKVVAAGLLTFVVSGPEGAYEEAKPYLDQLGSGVTYVGSGDRARLAKICHNLLLGVVAQSLAEILVLAEKGGISRADLMEFINKSVMGSMFTRYKTPALVNLDYSPTFTSVLLRKDFDLGFDLARSFNVSMPVGEAAGEVVQTLIDQGYSEHDFAALLEVVASAAAHDLRPENLPVGDGLPDQPERARTDAPRGS